MGYRFGQPLWHHLIFWSAYLLFEIHHEFAWLSTNYPNDSMMVSLRSAVVAQSSILIPKMLFTYWVVSRFWKQSRTVPLWLEIPLGLIISVLIYRLIIIFVTLPLAYPENPETQPFISWSNVSSSMIDLIFIAGVASALIALQRSRHLQTDKLRAELNALKQQVHPHFLFNTLNNIYALAVNGSTKTTDAIKHLADVTRFLLYETPKDRVILKSEWEILNQYLELEKLRYGDRLKLSVQYPDIPDSVQIAPLLLLPLVENAFKHGASLDDGQPEINIQLALDESHVRLRVDNSCNTSQNDKPGIGLANLRRQLELQHPGHRLWTDRQEDRYFAELTIPMEIK